MLLCYVDESFSRDHYYIAALLCPDRQALSLGVALDRVVRRATVTYPAISTAAELHGYDIFQGKNDWEPLRKMPRARIQVYDQALRVLAEHEVAVVVRGIHPVERLRTQHPHALLMRWILEEIDEYAGDRDEYALVIADEPGQNSQQSEYRADLTGFRQYGTGGWRPRVISRVVDTLHFAPSASSRLVQASDLVAFLCHRISTKTDGDPRAIRANTRLWERLADRIHRVHVWTPSDRP
ncbi:hypothetical protein B1813_02020 [Saccharomonospora piscinae]|uniref:DUF3800 domain-containing protein n=1 Tax=Saccharomonospora piscinae TaxID=687388 RepID=A0A1V9ACS0_SACPI|nr:hypothetical protein B1813_02020 [Saccharomonospora piscinae]TLW95295.1 DUF3800 domain-containing protein [Saccharomonospora piscinae]